MKINVIYSVSIIVIFFKKIGFPAKKVKRKKIKHFFGKNIKVVYFHPTKNLHANS